jgi:AcrR family transcriptional regulator
MDRRERERAARRALILTTARRLAEAEGWPAVTTRRLAELVEYSQPVLYSHFPGKEAIVAAVALDGFGELAAALRAQTGTAAVATAYLDFARDNPALYDAMFARPTSLTFAADDTPAVLREGFAALAAGLPDRPGRETATELLWSALHGMATLERGGRLRPGQRRERLDRLVALFAGDPAAVSPPAAGGPAAPPG